MLENRSDVAAHIHTPATGILAGQGVGIKLGMSRIGQKQPKPLSKLPSHFGG